MKSHGCLRIIYILLLLADFTIIKAQVSHSLNPTQIIDLGLPVVWIETLNNEEPSFDPITPPEGSIGNSITNATIVSCRIRIQNTDSTFIYDSADFGTDLYAAATIKVRGNSSACQDKKPYKIELQRATDLLFRNGEEACKDNDWLLLKNDKMSLNSLIGLKINQLMKLPWTPKMEYVNVIFNNNYRGLYMLTETVSRNTNGKIDVDKNTGFITEYDPYWWNESLYFPSKIDTQRFNYTLKYPKEKNLTDIQQQYITEELESVEKGIMNNTYSEWIDVNNFASWLLGHDILGTYDGAGSNMFMAKYDSTSNSKLQMTNLWDFDTIMSDDNQWSSEHYCFYYPYLINDENSTFITAYSKRWDEVSPLLFDSIVNYLESFRTSKIGIAVDKSRPYDSQCYPTITPGKTIKEDIEDAKQWFAKRKYYLAAKIFFIKKNIERNEKYKSNSNDIPFDLLGRIYQRNAQSIYIMNGKKYMK